MTVIAVRHLTGRLSREHKQALAGRLTDAVLETECGKVSAAGRIGFQVHFSAFQPDDVALGGALFADSPQPPDLMLIDVAVMDGDWPRDRREKVVGDLLSACADVLGEAAPPYSWWVNFRTIDDGSWGASGRTISMLDLLDSGAFTDERAAAVRKALETAG